MGSFSDDQRTIFAMFVGAFSHCGTHRNHCEIRRLKQKARPSRAG